jgi:hypothetical protein
MPPGIRKEVRSALRDAGQQVREDAAQKTAGKLRSPKSAAGYRVVVRQRGVFVEQSLRKTTGLRPKWGGTQMRDSLIPALEEDKDDTARRMEEAMQNVVDLFVLLSRWQGEGLIGTEL